MKSLRTSCGRNRTNFVIKILSLKRVPVFQYVKPQSTDSGLERPGLRMNDIHRIDQDEDKKIKNKKI